LHDRLVRGRRRALDRCAWALVLDAGGNSVKSWLLDRPAIAQVDGTGNSLGLALGRVAWVTDPQYFSPFRQDIPLLNDVSQFMGKQEAARVSLRYILTIPKDDMGSDCVGSRLDSPRRLRRPGVGVDPHAAEVMAEAQFERRPDSGFQGLSRRVQDLVRNRRGHRRRSGSRGKAPDASFLHATLRAFRSRS
jgi:hypothetical protein